MKTRVQEQPTPRRGHKATGLVSIRVMSCTSEPLILCKNDRITTRCAYGFILNGSANSIFQLAEKMGATP